MTVTSFEVDDYQRNKPKAWEAARRAVPRQPLAMGNVEMIVDVRPARAKETT